MLRKRPQPLLSARTAKNCGLFNCKKHRHIVQYTGITMYRHLRPW